MECDEVLERTQIFVLFATVSRIEFCEVLQFKVLLDLDKSWIEKAIAHEDALLLLAYNVINFFLNHIHEELDHYVLLLWQIIQENALHSSCNCLERKNLRAVKVHLFVDIDKFNLEEGIEALRVKLLHLGDIVEDLML